MKRLRSRQGHRIFVIARNRGRRLARNANRVANCYCAKTHIYLAFRLLPKLNLQRSCVLQLLYWRALRRLPFYGCGFPDPSLAPALLLRTAILLWEDRHERIFTFVAVALGTGEVFPDWTETKQRDPQAHSKSRADNTAAIAHPERQPGSSAGSNKATIHDAITGD
jgi:hypothetical protein